MLNERRKENDAREGNAPSKEEEGMLMDHWAKVDEGREKKKVVALNRNERLSELHND